MIRNETGLPSSLMAGKVGSRPQRCLLQDRGQDSHTYHPGCLQAEVIESRSWDQKSKGFVVGATAREREGRHNTWRGPRRRTWKLPVREKGEFGGLWAAEEPCSGHRLPEPALSMPSSLLLLMLSRNFGSFRRKVPRW